MSAICIKERYHLVIEHNRALDSEWECICSGYINITCSLSLFRVREYDTFKLYGMDNELRLYFLTFFAALEIFFNVTLTSLNGYSSKPIKHSTDMHSDDLVCAFSEWFNELIYSRTRCKVAELIKILNFLSFSFFSLENIE